MTKSLLWLIDMTVSPPHGIYGQLTEADFIGRRGEDDLFIACAKGSIQDIENNCADVSKVKDHNSLGYSALHVAVLSDRPDIEDVIDVLLNNGVDVNGVTISEWDTALHLIAHRGDYTNGLQVAVKLLENGAKTDIRNKRLQTPYDCAISRNFIPLASILEGTLQLDSAKDIATQETQQYWGKKLIEAVFGSDKEMFSECLRRGADMNLLNQHGAGAVHYAVTHCKLATLEILRKMVEGGCDINLRDHEGDTALNLVVKTERLRTSGEMNEIVEYLLSNGADVSFKDLDGKDSRDLAQERQYHDIVTLLGAPFRAKPDPRPSPQPIPEPLPEPTPEPPKEPSPVPTPQPESPEMETEAVAEAGLKPIHRAILIKNQRQREQRISELFRLRANINGLTLQEKNTALHVAVKNNRPETVRQLLKYGAKQTMINKDRKTALALAKDEGFRDIQQILEEDLKKSATNAMKKKSSTCAVM
ncbi:serine/threonine-protein phosphatase 6 regulatory ankyrin repeat subunit B-like isoform X2 [Liolophura sinensis]|uniref:serine/threonine-protein phosphatase 6 regulatory ankyrin repeat subunit B-like isoform X2 n=1 Tax=Liolophura sinensis TaxID=3198878 RepID=UPI0031588B87